MAGRTKTRSPDEPPASVPVIRSKPVKRTTQLPEDSTSNSVPEKGIQPVVSPYTTRPITLTIGATKVPYYIPSYFLFQFARWREDFGPDSHKDELELPEVDESVGHTFVHYLYTGTYQTTRAGDGTAAARHLLEYKRSVLTHVAASLYGLDGLATLARQQTAQFRPRVSLVDTLEVARSVYLNGLSDNSWIDSYVKKELEEAYDSDETIFTKPVYLGIFGQAPEFDKVLVKVMIKLLTNRISQLKVEVQDQVDARLSIYSTSDLLSSPVVQPLQPEITAPVVAEILPPRKPGQDESFSPGIIDKRKSGRARASFGHIQAAKSSWPMWQSNGQSDNTVNRGKPPGGLFY